MWKKLPRLRMKRVIRIRPVTSPVRSNTTREGKYLRPETNREGPGLSRIRNDYDLLRLLTITQFFLRKNRKRTTHTYAFVHRAN